jgi:3-oxoacyl-[acyl-carrier-protein] synthase II
MRHRVVVTGIGCVTPLGNNVEQMWDSLKRCANGVGPITHFPAEDFPTRFAAEVKDFSIADYVDDPERFVHSSPNILYAIGWPTVTSNHRDSASTSAPEKVARILSVTCR